MSTNAKIVLGIVIAVIVIGAGVWWWIAIRSTSPMPTAVNVQNNPTLPENATTSVPTTTTQDDSDQAIGQDMASMNAQMNGFNSDSASMDQSFNDQPVQQGQ